MPLQVRASPEYLPQILSSYIGRLGERVLANDRWVVPLRANLEYFDALPSQPVADVEFRTYVRRGRRLAKKVAMAFSMRLMSRSLNVTADTSGCRENYAIVLSGSFLASCRYANSRPGAAAQLGQNM